MNARFLQVPLAWKLAGANALIALTAWAAVFLGHDPNMSSGRMLTVLSIALLGGLLVNLVLVTIALRPIRELEETVRRIWRGESRVRVPRSPVGDPDLDQVGETVNALLDHLDEDRERMHSLATEIIRTEDRERARVGSELTDSIAQGLAAVTYHLTAVEGACSDPEAAARIRAIRLDVGEILDQVDVLSHTVHPRVLNDLGLYSGLRHLARTVARGSTEIDVELSSGTERDLRGIGIETASVLYRVAQEAIQNALRHSGANRVVVSAGAQNGRVNLRVDDTGSGFDLAEAQRRRPGMGLFTMRERVALMNGDFSVETAPGSGTSVRASIPVEGSSTHNHAASHAAATAS